MFRYSNRDKRKAFTIVELVIVIAIIAILAAVLIPTFSKVIMKADESSCLQSAKSKYNELCAIDFSDGSYDGEDNGNSFINSDHKVNLSGYDGCCYYPEENDRRFTYNDGKYTATLKIQFSQNEWSVAKSGSSSSSS